MYPEMNDKIEISELAFLELLNYLDLGHKATLEGRRAPDDLRLAVRLGIVQLMHRFLWFEHPGRPHLVGRLYYGK